jgi:hypothetical protein
MPRLIGTHAEPYGPHHFTRDDLQNITVDCILAAAKNDGFELKTVTSSA